MRVLSFLLLIAPFLTGQICQLSELPSDGTVGGALIETDCAVKDLVRGETSVLRGDGWKLTLREPRVFRLRQTSTEIVRICTC